MSKHSPIPTGDFERSLQEFSNRVSITTGLESGGKIGSAEAYERLKEYWQKLSRAFEETQLQDWDQPTKHHSA